MGKPVPGEQAASPVVGTVLVLLIALAGIVLVLFWGLPAIQTVQDNTQFDAMVEQFRNVDGVLDDVLKGTPERATRVTFSIPEGEIRYDSNPAWVVTAYVEAGGDRCHRLEIDAWSDGDASFELLSTGQDLVVPDECAFATPLPKADVEVATLSGQTATVIHSGTTGDAPWASYSIVATQELSRQTVRIRLTDDATGDLVTESWILPLGRLSHAHASSIQTYRVDSEGGAVFSMIGDRAAMREEPSAVREDNATDVLSRFTLWALNLQQSGSGQAVGGAGGGEYDILFSLSDNYLRVDQRSTLKVELSATGDLADVWYHHFETKFSMARWTNPDTDTQGGVWLAAEVGDDPFGFAVIQPVVNIASGSSGQALGPA